MVLYSLGVNRTYCYLKLVQIATAKLEMKNQFIYMRSVVKTRNENFTSFNK